LGFLCWVRTLCQRVSSARGGIGVAARPPSARVFGAHARHGVDVRPLLCRHHGLELEILFYDSHRFLNRDYIMFDCGRMAFSQKGLHASVAIVSLSASRKGGLLVRWEGTPSPLDLCNHRVSWKSQIKSWRSITCGQNLDVKELTLRARGMNSQNETDALSAHRHGLDDDRATRRLCARSDVT
jgi:hypothetical protein